jgi:hypothetical protein
MAKPTSVEGTASMILFVVTPTKHRTSLRINPLDLYKQAIMKIVAYRHKHAPGYALDSTWIKSSGL